MAKENKKILLIDDSIFAHTVVKDMFEGLNIELVAAAIDGDKGIELYRETKPDVVLLDIVLPGRHGDVILEDILKQDPDAKVIMVSSLATENKIMQCLRKGAKNFVAKPFEKQELINAIEEVMKAERVSHSVVSVLKDANVGGKFFGQYLLAKNRITQQQLEDGLKYQKEKNLTLETMCIRGGYITKEHAREIHEEQRKIPDKSFSELAVEKGFIDQESLEDVIREQKKNQIYFGEALTGIGVLKKEEVEEELKNFKGEQDKIESEIIYNLYKMEDKDAVKIFVSFTVNAIKLFEQMLGIPVKINSCVPLAHEFEIREYLIEQDAHGTVSTKFLFNFSKDIAKCIASVLFSKQVTSVDTYGVDALKEFLNIVSGNCCSKLSNIGLDIEMNAPELWEGTEYPKGGKYTFISLISAGGDFEILMSLPK
ncbi:MAG: response regulator [bacterium]